MNVEQTALVLENSITESFATCGTCSNCNGRECGVTTMRFKFDELVTIFGHALALQITDRTKQQEDETRERWAERSMMVTL